MENSKTFAGMKVFNLIAVVFLACITLLIVTTPLDVESQTLFGISGVVLCLIVGRIKSSWSRLVLMMMSVIISTRYLYWRSTDTLVYSTPLETILGFGLLLAEIYSWIIMVLGFLQTVWPLNRQIVPLPKDTSLWPTVDVYIPTYNESLAIVQDTVLAALNMDYPKDKFKVYLLDDGRRPEFGAFASAAGVGYITRTDNNHAKAGNLNNAMKYTNGELICIFDCDHVATRIFLQATVGAFLKEPNLALLQTPHHFYSPDPFERNLHTSLDVPGEGELFYGPVQKGNDFWNAAFFCGSCAVIRRKALDETNGFAVQTVTEDSHTALKLQRKGWDTAFLSIRLSAGLATERLSLHIGQRARWARGMC
ncbi:glycosyltransferase [Shewanella sp. A3A]|nr:glycosyltransferase [Shewanella ferrihydritica]